MRPLFNRTKSNLLSGLIWLCGALVVAVLVMAARVGLGFDQGGLAKMLGLAILIGVLVYASLRLGLEALHVRLQMRSGDDLHSPEMSTMTFHPRGRGVLPKKGR